jgi:NAD(P)-dependent dehydrogenase (short-subunit alcohol dehydrogenase family)
MSSGQFEGRNVFITGAGSGFGRATALAFAREGARQIHLADIRSDRVAAVAEEVAGLGAEPHQYVVDVGATSQVDDAFQAALAVDPAIHVVVSNAALFAPPANVLDLTDEAWTREVSTSLGGAFAVASRAARAMVAAKVAGSILFTASMSASRASAGFAAYCSTKAAVVMLTKVMALDLAPHGIRVNCVSPGPADTARSVEYIGEEAMARLRGGHPSIPLSRLASPEDIAQAFLYLASDGASYVTGQDLVVDGGLTLQVPWAPLD